MNRLMLACALVALHTAASAEVFLPIRIDGPAKAVVASGSAAMRIGKAALVSVHAQFPQGKGGASYSVLAACDGSWASTIVGSSTASADVAFPDAYLARFNAERPTVPTDGVEFIDAREVRYPFWEGLKAQMPALCASSVAANDRVLFGVAGSAGPGANEGMTRSILPGTAERRGTKVDIWMRDSIYSNEPIMMLGKPWIVDGKAQTKRVLSGKYETSRAVFDCAARTVGISQLVENDGKSATPKTTTVLEKDLIVEPVGRGTVGEGTLDAVCRIF